MNKAVKLLLKALSYDEIEVEASRRLADLKRLGSYADFCEKTG